MKEMEKTVLDAVNEAEVTEIARRLVQTPTFNPPGDELALAKVIAPLLEAEGLRPEIHEFAPSRANLVCRMPGSGELPPLVFCGHMDTVPVGEENWHGDPFSGKIVNGGIYGRGSVDMKGGIASLLGAFLALKRSGAALRGGVILALTAGEEVDTCGAMELAKSGVLSGAGGMLIAEPTNFEVCTAHKGALWLNAVTRGKAAHGSMPQHGRNAILPMAEYVQYLAGLKLEAAPHPLLSSPTLLPSTIRGGFKTNIVPDRCSLTVDIRTVPSMDHRELFRMLSDRLEETANRYEVKSEMSMLLNHPPIDTPADHPFVRRFIAIAEAAAGRKLRPVGGPYFTDGSVLVPALKIPTVICGPGDGSLAHQADEWVSTESLAAGARLFVLTALEFLA